MKCHVCTEPICLDLDGCTQVDFVDDDLVLGITITCPMCLAVTRPR